MAVILDYALTTVADVKETLGIDSGDSSKNNLIIRKINQATEIIERYTGRRFKATTYTDEEYDASGTDQLVLRQRPINSITSVSARDSATNDNDWEAIDTEFYFTDSKAGIVEGVFNYSGGWNRYKVTYNAGYTTIPSDLAEAAVALAAYLVENNVSGTAVKRKTEGQRSIEYFDQTGMNSADTSLFAQLGILGTLNSYANNPVLENV